jgi:hypothetical protein
MQIHYKCAKSSQVRLRPEPLFGPAGLVAFSDLDPDCASPTDPEVLEEDFMAAMHSIACMQDSGLFDFPPQAQVARLLSRLLQYWLEVPEPDMASAALLCAFLTAVPRHPEFGQNPCLLELLSQLFHRISVHDFTDDTIAIVASSSQMWDMCNANAKANLAVFFLNALCDVNACHMIFNEDIPERLLGALEIARDEYLVASLLNFFCVCVFVSRGSDEDRIVALCQRLLPITLRIFEAVSPLSTPKEEPLVLGPSLELIVHLIDRPEFLRIAVQAGFPLTLIEKTPGFYAVNTLRSFFNIVGLLLKTEETRALFNKPFFEVLVILANRACATCSVQLNPFELFKSMNRQYWRQFCQSPFIPALLELSGELSFQARQNVSAWLIDLVVEADVEARREIANGKWFDLVLQQMHSDDAELINRLGWTFLKMRDDDAEFWSSMFEKIDLLNVIDCLEEELQDSQSLEVIATLREQLFPESYAARVE